VGKSVGAAVGENVGCAVGEAVGAQVPTTQLQTDERDEKTLSGQPTSMKFCPTSVAFGIKIVVRCGLDEKAISEPYILLYAPICVAPGMVTVCSLLFS